MITAEHLPGIQIVQADLESRRMSDTSNWMLNKGIFKLKKKSDLGAIENRSLCRQVQHTTGKIHELASRSICNGNGCISDTLEQEKRVCFPSILPNNKVFVLSSERKV